MGENEKWLTPGLETYLNDFGLTREQLKGKTILDLGAGFRQVARDCERLSLAKVCSIADVRTDWYPILETLDRARMMEKDSEELELWRRVNRKSLEGLMQELPFADNSFDMVVSRDALTHVFESAAVMAMGMMEALRVVKPEGEVLIFPGWMKNWQEHEMERVWRALDRLDREHFHIEVQSIQRDWAGMKAEGKRLVLRKSNS